MKQEEDEEEEIKKTGEKCSVWTNGTKLTVPVGKISRWLHLFVLSWWDTRTYDAVEGWTALTLQHGVIREYVAHCSHAHTALLTRTSVVHRSGCICALKVRPAECTEPLYMTLFCYRDAQSVRSMSNLPSNLKMHRHWCMITRTGGCDFPLPRLTMSRRGCRKISQSMRSLCNLMRHDNLNCRRRRRRRQYHY